MNLTLKVWRQDGPQDKGHLETHQLSGVTGDMSFLEMMDVLNEKSSEKGATRLRLTTTAAKAFAACAPCSSTARLTGLVVA